MLPKLNFDKGTVLMHHEGYNDDFKNFTGFSYSGLKHLIPDFGGSPQLFDKYLKGELEKKESAAINFGQLIHKYLENPGEFYIAEINAPTEVNKKWVEAVLESFPDTPYNDIDVNYIVKIAFDNGFHKNIKDPVKLQTKYITECLPYHDYLVTCNRYEHVISEQEKHVFEMIKQELYKNREFVFTTANPDNMFYVYNELALVVDYDGLTIKSISDKVTVEVHKDVSEVIIRIIDYKTTGAPVINFEKGIISNGYDVQAYLNIINVFSFIKTIIPNIEKYNIKIEFSFLVINTSLLYNSQLVSIPPIFGEFTRQRINTALDLYNSWLEKGDTCLDGSATFIPPYRDYIMNEASANTGLEININDN